MDKLSTVQTPVISIGWRTEASHICRYSGVYQCMTTTQSSTHLGEKVVSEKEYLSAMVSRCVQSLVKKRTELALLPVGGLRMGSWGYRELLHRSIVGLCSGC